MVCGFIKVTAVIGYRSGRKQMAVQWRRQRVVQRLGTSTKWPNIYVQVGACQASAAIGELRTNLYVFYRWTEISRQVENARGAMPRSRRGYAKHEGALRVHVTLARKGISSKGLAPSIRSLTRKQLIWCRLSKTLTSRGDQWRTFDRLSLHLIARKNRK